MESTTFGICSSVSRSIWRAIGVSVHGRRHTTKYGHSHGKSWRAEISVFNARENVYATAAKPGSLDEAIDYFINNLDMRFPLAEMLSSKLAEMLAKRVRAAYDVGQESIAGVLCDHLAFRGDQADLQLWIAKGEQPLPRRLVITYKQAAGQPQFWAQFGDWNLSPEVPDSLFAFTPPEGAAKIAFASRRPAQTGERERKSKKGARQ